VEGGGQAEGLKLLPTPVTLQRRKETWQVQARPCGRLPWLDSSVKLTGYEIHMGRGDTPSPLFELHRPNGEVAHDGAATSDGRVWGTHLHGLFHNDAFRWAWLRSLGWQPSAEGTSAMARQMAAYDRLADALEAALDIRRLDEIIGL